jgi:hypothetical protein
MPPAKTIDEYLAALPDDRRHAVTEIRRVINKNIPKGFAEGISYGMISWYVPHSLYPAGYHCDPSKPLMLISLASEKNHIALYHMGIYAGPLADWFKKEWPRHSSRKLDMGKSCVRFRKFEDVPLKLIGELAAQLTPKAWIATYEAALGRNSEPK